MEIKVGCDIVSVERFGKVKKEALEKIFHPSELKGSPDRLAGIFAVKECVKKVFNDLGWLDIEVKKMRHGKPELIIYKPLKGIESYDISIAHDGGYAFAIAVFLI